MLKPFKHIWLALIGVGFLGTALPTSAAMVHYHFTGGTDSGAFADQSYAGNFSFDSSGFTGSGTESFSLASFGFSFLGNSYSLAAADGPASAHFLDGVFLGIELVNDTDPADPLFAFHPALGSTDPGDVAFFSYHTVAGDSGFGSLSFQSLQVAAPGGLLLMPFALLALRARRRIGG